MEASQDQFNARHLLVFMLIDRHTAAIITDFDQSILMQDQGQLAGKACQCLIDTVVDDFLNEVIRTGCIGIHTRALANGVKAGKYFNRVGVVVIGHREWIQNGGVNDCRSIIFYRTDSVILDSKNASIAGNSSAYPS